MDGIACKTLRYVNEMALYFCIRNDLAKLDRLLARPGVKKVMDVNAVCDKSGRFALHHAAFLGNLEMVQLLMGLNADHDGLSLP